MAYNGVHSVSANINGALMGVSASLLHAELMQYTRRTTMEYDYHT
jgi:hypothetical protein